MNIALLGYGKMGKAIEKIAVERGHQITYKTNKTKKKDIIEADIAIDFSTPKVAYNHISRCLKQNLPIISGTTGWLKDYENAVALCEQTNGTFLYAPNFSLGVNMFFKLNDTLAKLMNSNKEYQSKIKEIHHTEKIDAPSGTAITLANNIIKNHSKYKKWSLNPKKKEELPIVSKRFNNDFGTHKVYYKSFYDSIQIKHTAHSRDGFAIGVVIAAEWLLGKQGVYSIQDVLNLG